MLKLKSDHLLLVLLVCSFLTAGCGNEPVVGTSPPDEIKPLGFPEKYFNTDKVTVGQMPDDFAIGTPKSPLFYILDGYMIYCQGEMYIILHVRNHSGWAFQYMTWGAANDSNYWIDLEQNYEPFHHSGKECPKQPAFSHLASGEEAYLYLPITHSPGNNTYDIWVEMCTYMTESPFPPNEDDHCVLRNYQLALGDNPFKLIFFLVDLQWLCWTGPSQAYPVVAGLGKGNIVQVVGVAEDPEWVVIQHPKYGVDCYVDKGALKFPNFDYFEELTVVADPALPPECPTGKKWDPEARECVKIVQTCGDLKTKEKCLNNPTCYWEVGFNVCLPKRSP